MINFLKFTSNKNKKNLTNFVTKLSPFTNVSRLILKIYKRSFSFDDAENTTSKSHDPRTLLMAPAQQEETIFVECTGVVPAKCPPKIKSELFSLL